MDQGLLKTTESFLTTQHYTDQSWNQHYNYDGKYYIKLILFSNMNTIMMLMSNIEIFQIFQITVHPKTDLF